MQIIINQVHGTRIFGFANDKTIKNNLAIIWKPEIVINLNSCDDLMSYRGDMGNNGCIMI